MCIKFGHINKKCTDCTKYKFQTKISLKLKMHVFSSYKHMQCTHYTKPIQLANWNGLCMLFVHTNNVQTMQNVYKC